MTIANFILYCLFVTYVFFSFNTNLFNKNALKLHCNNIFKQILQNIGF